MKEYILVYCKDNNHFNGLVGEINSNSETYPCIKTTNARGIRIIRKGTISKAKERDYVIEPNTRISSGNMELIYLDRLVVKNNIVENDVRIDSNWIYSQNLIDEFSEKNLSLWKKTFKFVADLLRMVCYTHVVKCDKEVQV